MHPPPTAWIIFYMCGLTVALFLRSMGLGECLLRIQKQRFHSEPTSVFSGEPGWHGARRKVLTLIDLYELLQRYAGHANGSEVRVREDNPQRLIRGLAGIRGKYRFTWSKP